MSGNAKNVEIFEKMKLKMGLEYSDKISFFKLKFFSKACMMKGITTVGEKLLETI